MFQKEKPDTDLVTVLLWRLEIFPPIEGITWDLLSGLEFCEPCRGLIVTPETGWKQPGFSPRFRSDTATIKASASKGCQICNGILAAWLHFVPAVEFEEPEGGEKRSVWVILEGPASIQVEVIVSPTSVIYFSLSLVRDVDDDDGEALLPPDYISFMRTQLDNCRTNPRHNCNEQQTEATPEWPQRMLEISGDKVLLVDFDVQRMRYHYAALSYCWGSKAELEAKPNLTATSSTLANLRLGIPIAQLPRTLREAVMVCLCLSLSYIWIDSLCIVQDDIRDWEIEAAKMSTVYNQATVTIIAASSTSCHSGFLPPGREQGSLRLDIPSLLPVRLLAEKQTNENFHLDMVTLDPIDHRGWTYQEQVLSNRYIKFKPTDIEWSCSAGQSCLCGNLPSSLQWPRVRQGMLDLTHWIGVTYNFSGRAFTQETDKLLALSGLASSTASSLQSQGKDATYLAGMWRHKMVESVFELNWDIIFGGKAECTAAYIAPSFSWASVNDKVLPFSSWITRPALELSKVVDSDIQLATENGWFGQVSGGYLEIRGPLVPCSLRVENNGTTQAEPVPEFAERFVIPGYQDYNYLSFDGGFAEYVTADGRKTLHRCLGPECLLAKSDQNNHKVLWAAEITEPGKTPASVVQASMLFLGLVSLGDYEEEKDLWLPQDLLTLNALILGPSHLDNTGYQRLGSTRFPIREGVAITAEEMDAWSQVVKLY